MGFTLIFVLVIFGFVASQVQDSEKRCVSLYECPKLYEQYTQATSFTDGIQFLKSWKCGSDEEYNIKVWCDDFCKTPNGASGKCIPVHDCDSYMQLVKSYKNYTKDVVTTLSKYRCDGIDKNTWVCCELPKPTVKPPVVEVPIVKPAVVAIPTVNPPVIDISKINLLPKFEQTDCGLSPLDNKIVGGTKATIDDFPWMARLHYNDDVSNPTTVCAGSLINSKYVLTAAHCVDKDTVRKFGSLTHVTLGDYDTRTKTDCVKMTMWEECADPELVVEVENFIAHPNWETRSRGQLEYDIALIRLKQSVTYTDFIKPICIPSKNPNFEDRKNLTVAGWGSMGYGHENGSFTKMKVTVPLYNKHKCAQEYISQHLYVENDVLCAGGEADKDSCEGDSGGPLMYSIINSGNYLWHLLGIVSFGFRCGTKVAPAVYTEVSSYYDWILQTIEP